MNVKRNIKKEPPAFVAGGSEPGNSINRRVTVDQEFSAPGQYRKFLARGIGTILGLAAADLAFASRGIIRLPVSS